jgi:hypothetical protein
MGSQSSVIRNNTGIRPDLKAILLGLDGDLGAVNGDVFYVDAYDGSDGNDGSSWSRPILTMAEAFTRVASGDSIVFRGKVTEQISTPVQVQDVTVIGAGTRPRNADAAPADPTGRSHGASWQPVASEVATTPLCTVRQQGWRFVNILFDCPSDDAGVELLTTGGSGNDERTGSHASFYGCKFVTGSVGVQDSGGAGFIYIDDCDFQGLTSAIESVSGAGIGQPWFRSVIKNSRFTQNTNHIVIPSEEVIISDNVFGVFTTKGIDVSGGTGQNIVTRNLLSGTYSNLGGYTAGTNDCWFGNYGSSGVTSGSPA